MAVHIPSGMPVHIERASPADAAQIAAVLLAAFREFEPLYTPAGFQATTPAADVIASRLAEGPTWVARKGDDIVGTISALSRGDEVYVRSMAVLPAARGHGIAAQLLSIAEEYAAGQGAHRLTLTTTPFLTAAILLYERAGFRRTPEKLNLHGTPLIGMVKELGDVADRG